MAHLKKTDEVSLINIKLTGKGREFLAKGFKDDNVFDIVKFAFGDSEVDYRLTTIDDSLVLEPSSEAVDLTHKVYASGSIPSGTSLVSLTNTIVSMTTHQSGIDVGASTTWPPIEGAYSEQYKWTNLGPLNDYDFSMNLSLDTKTATFSTFDTTGTTSVKVAGETSGKYAIITLTIT